MRFGMRNRARDDRGQALVEFALVAPILILMVVAVWEIAHAWQAYQTITDAGREAARNAVVDESICDFAVKPTFCPASPATRRDVLDALMNQRLGESGLYMANVQTSGTGCAGGGSWANACVAPAGDLTAVSTGEAVVVTVRYQHGLRVIGALLSWATGDRFIELKSEFVMRKE